MIYLMTVYVHVCVHACMHSMYPFICLPTYYLSLVYIYEIQYVYRVHMDVYLLSIMSCIYIKCSMYV